MTILSASYSLVADILARSLTSVFDNLCTQRYGGSLSFRQFPQADAPSTVRFELDRADLPPLGATFTIRHIGGNMYDLVGMIDDGPCQSFSYCLPDPTPTPLPHAPHLAQAVATFLLDALERRLGGDLLRRGLPPERQKGAQQATLPAHAPSVV
jgi:hypothetical protein